MCLLVILIVLKAAAVPAGEYLRLNADFLFLSVFLVQTSFGRGPWSGLIYVKFCLHLNTRFETED
jgi:hypothetical protein